jgi:hypothetical protein
MPRIIVTTDLSQLPDDTPVLLDEHVQSVHLSTDHAATQFIERLAWAISDAEDAEPEPLERRVRPAQGAGRRRGPAGNRVRASVGR